MTWLTRLCNQQLGQTRPSLAVVMLLMAIAVVIRGGSLYLQRQHLAADPDAYRQIAENLRKTGVFSLNHESGRVHPTAFRPPLYPLLLAAIATPEGNVTSAAVLLLHLLLGVATVLLTYFLARKLLLSTPAALLAALLVLLDPILLRQQTLVMTETIATFFTVAVLAAAVIAFASETNSRRHALLQLALGALWGLSILCRPTFLPWLLLFLGLLLLYPVCQRSEPWPKGRAATAFFFVVSGVLLTNVHWVNRNARVFRAPILTTTHGGYTLLLANNAEFYEHLKASPSSLPWKSEQLDALLATEARKRQIADDDRKPRMAREGSVDVPLELVMDRYSRDAALESIRNHPSGFVRATLHRWWQLVSPVPNRLTDDESNTTRWARYAVALWYLALYALAIAGLYRLFHSGRWHEFLWLAALLLPLSLLAIHTFYWTNLRMRAPAMPVIALVAGAAVSWPQAASKKS